MRSPAKIEDNHSRTKEIYCLEYQSVLPLNTNTGTHTCIYTSSLEKTGKFWWKKFGDFGKIIFILKKWGGVLVGDVSLKSCYIIKFKILTDHFMWIIFFKIQQSEKELFCLNLSSGFPLLLGFCCCQDRELWVRYVFNAAIFENIV